MDKQRTCKFKTPNGRCSKRSWAGKCNLQNGEWDISGELITIEPDEMCEKASIYGNEVYGITEEQIEELKAGKVLYDVEEYGVFLKFKPKEKAETEGVAEDV